MAKAAKSMTVTIYKLIHQEEDNYYNIIINRMECHSASGSGVEVVDDSLKVNPERSGVTRVSG